MTDFSDFTTQIAEYANRQDWAAATVIGFVRQAEELFNRDLRIDRMLQSDDALIASRCAPLPDDWLEMDFVRLAFTSDRYPGGFAPIYYKPRAEFFSTQDQDAIGIYTIEGRQIFIGGLPDMTNGQTVRIDYYQEVPVFSDTTPSYIYTKYPSLYLNAALYRAALHAVGEEQSAGNYKQMTDEAIRQLNVQHRYSRASGSRLSRTRTRSFG